MKEYWVNVYARCGTKQQWLGSPYITRLAANYAYGRGNEPAYRIHVKMKEPKPKYEPPFIGMKLSNGDWI